MHLPRWQREQQARQKKKLAILFRLAILIIILGVLAGVGLFLVRQVRSSKLPPNSRITLVFRTSPVIVTSFDPDGQLTILSIPEKTYVEVPYGFGSYRLGAVWDLGEQEKMGGKLLAETMQELIGLPIEGWIGGKQGTGNIEQGQETVLNAKNNLTSWGIFLRPGRILESLKNLKTNLTVMDLAKIWLRAKNTRFDKIFFLDLEKTSALSPLVLADGSEAKTLDLSLLDIATAGLFKESKVVNERILIEVLNGADKPGLASRVARLITNIGGKIVNVGTSQEKVDRCQIKGEGQFVESFTASELSRVFNCELKTGKPDSRADLQLIIGEDYWRKLFQKEPD